VGLTLSLHLPSLGEDLATGLRTAVEHGFTHVDVAVLADRPPSHLEALADAGVVVAAADLPTEPLVAESVALRRAALETARRQIADAARLGATVCCLSGPPITDDVLALLDQYAAARMIRLCAADPGGPPDVLRDGSGRVVHLRLPAEGRPEAARLAPWVERLCGEAYRGAVAIRHGEGSHGG
jgi:sugar phosphate isomerase/epimerase